MKRFRNICVYTALLFGLSGCLNHAGHYNFSDPTSVIHLDEELNEISGLHLINDSTIACVQDEKGTIYHLNPTSNSIVSEIPFHRKGDYEGIAHYQNKYYVLQSNGTILIIGKNGVEKKVEFDGCKDSDFEGLCLDIKHDRLLVACKESCKKKDEDNILVYSFLIHKKKYKKNEVYRLKKKDIHKNFKSSGIAVHPNGNIYLLSSFAKTLAIVSKTGDILDVHSLSSYIFHQPEGITFSRNGDLYISNERNTGKPSLMKLNY
ncbi:MAG: SdiA-regulated domain-containing protein [Bacteroidia bacterium]|nr:SdiA-regulated domain-containing protein [Bacteroidia bacterium]